MYEKKAERKWGRSEAASHLTGLLVAQLDDLFHCYLDLRIFGSLESKKGRSQPASHLTGLMRKHVRECGSGSTAILRQKYKQKICWNLCLVWSLQRPRLWYQRIVFTACQGKSKAVNRKAFSLNVLLNSGSGHPLLLVFTGFQAWLHARPINLSSLHKSPECPKIYFHVTNLLSKFTNTSMA